YSAESSVTFETPGGAKPEPAGASSAGRSPPLAPGLSVWLSLQTEIDTDTAAAGDPVAALVTQDVFDTVTDKPPRGAKGVLLGRTAPKLVIPAHSMARGRIVRMEHRLDPSYFLIAIRFETVEYLGIVKPFTAKLR